jgi:hypothetical protein
VERFAALSPLCTSSIPASAPWAWTASVSSAWAAMSASSQSRPSTYGVTSVEGWISTSSVHTTAQPPSALTARMAAWARGSRHPIPLQCGTWKKRLRAVTGPRRTGSKRTS